jgi:flagellar protein FliS
MFGSIRSGASAYANISLETGVTAASPHKLIVMLMDGAMVAIAAARQHMQLHEIAKKGEAISKAITIIDSGLRASLDSKAGGEIAANLAALYEYMSNQLLTANLKNDDSKLQEVYELLKELKEAWESIEPIKLERQATVIEPKVQPYDTLTPRDNRYAKA